MQTMLQQYYNIMAINFLNYMHKQRSSAKTFKAMFVTIFNLATKTINTAASAIIGAIMPNHCASCNKTIHNINQFDDSSAIKLPNYGFCDKCFLKLKPIYCESICQVCGYPNKAITKNVGVDGDCDDDGDDVDCVTITSGKSGVHNCGSFGLVGDNGFNYADCVDYGDCDDSVGNGDPKIFIKCLSFARTISPQTKQDRQNEHKNCTQCMSPIFTNHNGNYIKQFNSELETELDAGLNTKLDTASRASSQSPSTQSALSAPLNVKFTAGANAQSKSCQKHAQDIPRDAFMDNNPILKNDRILQCNNILQMRSSFEYTPTIASIIVALKYKDELHNARLVAQYMADTFLNQMHGKIRNQININNQHTNNEVNRYLGNAFSHINGYKAAHNCSDVSDELNDNLNDNILDINTNAHSGSLSNVHISRESGANDSDENKNNNNGNGNYDESVNYDENTNCNKNAGRDVRLGNNDDRDYSSDSSHTFADNSCFNADYLNSSKTNANVTNADAICADAICANQFDDDAKDDFVSNDMSSDVNGDDSSDDGKHGLTMHYIVCVPPMHKQALSQRRYNQTSIVGQHFCSIIKSHQSKLSNQAKLHQCEKSNRPEGLQESKLVMHFIPDLLIKSKQTVSQASLTKQQRLTNLRDAIHINPNRISKLNTLIAKHGNILRNNTLREADFYGDLQNNSVLQSSLQDSSLQILIIDDVITTMSTMIECASALNIACNNACKIALKNA